MKKLMDGVLQRFQKLKQTLAPMTMRQRLDHLWTYYKGVLGVMVFLGLFAHIVATGIINANMETLISGLFINVDISFEGSTYVTDDYFAKLEGVEGEQLVAVSYSYFGELTSTQEVEYSYNAAMKTIAMVTGEQLDYIVTDDVGLDFYIGYDFFMDLREFFTAEEMKQWESDVIYFEPVGEEMYPVAIKLNDTAFAKKYLGANQKTCYLCFIANTPRPEQCRDFWEYLMACEAA